jgi:hypothetical protein
MAFTGFVNLSYIKGECTDKDHKDWCVVHSIAWKTPTGHGQALEFTVGHGAGVPLRVKAGKGTHIPEVIVDTGFGMVKGPHIPEVIVDTGWRAGGDPIPLPEPVYSRSRLWGAVVANIAVGPRADTFTLEFVQKLDGITLTKQKPDGTAHQKPDGTAGG